MPRTPRGFTPTDLSIVLVMLALLLGGVIPLTVGRTRETGGRVRCASNLRQIGMAIQLYTAANGGSLPRAAFDGQVAAPTEYTNWQAADPFGTGGPGPNDVTAALFLLVRTQILTPEVFVCPGVPDAQPWDYHGRTAVRVSNFPGRQFLGYSYLNTYPAPAATAAGYTIAPGSDESLPIAADMNPGGAAVVQVVPSSPRQRMSQANSRNHNGDGQNVLYADGHVEYQNTPFCGPVRNAGTPRAFRDNVYTFGVTGQPGGGVRGSPVDGLDAVLLPTALDGPVPRPGMDARTMWVGGALTAGVLLLFVVLRTRRAAHDR
jgi:prepilin-type processing-associated H-X9-DG protein